MTTRADNKQLDKREIYLVDDSGAEIALTLWGNIAKDFDTSNVRQVIGIKGAVVKEFNGRRLSFVL